MIFMQVTLYFDGPHYTLHFSLHNFATKSTYSTNPNPNTLLHSTTQRVTVVDM